MSRRGDRVWVGSQVAVVVMLVVLYSFWAVIAARNEGRTECLPYSEISTNLPG